MSRERWADRRNQEIRINSDEEQIASGSFAHRGRFHDVGVRFARMCSFGRRRAVEFPFGWPGQLAHEPSVRPSFAIELRRCPIGSVSGSHVVALPHGGASAACIATVGHGRRRGVIHRRRQHSFELCRSLGSSGSSRAACWGHRHQSRQSVASRSRRLAAHPRVAAPSRASWCRGLIRRTAQHANGADAPDGLVRSCHRGARLICTVRQSLQRLLGLPDQSPST